MTKKKQPDPPGSKRIRVYNGKTGKIETRVRSAQEVAATKAFIKTWPQRRQAGNN